MKIIKSKILSEYNELIHGVSSKIGLGREAPFYFNMSYSVGDDKNIVEENRTAFFSRLGIQKEAVQFQTHSDNITVVIDECNVKNNDALITYERGLALCVSIADCTPVMLFDKAKKIIAGIHSGWRGTEKKIVSKTLGIMKEKFSSEPEDIIAYIGPSICGKHYEVGKEVADLFGSKYVSEDESKLFLDVAGCSYDMLVDFGIPGKNIERSPLCTYEENYLHSFRRDKEKSGRMFSVIMMREED